jgi:hypothetical protein
VTDAVTLSTGRANPQTRKPEVVRLTKGQQVEAPDDHPAILTLLSTKSIRRTDQFTGKERITPRHIMRLYKDDVTAVENTAVAPIDAPAPVTDPNELASL